MAIPTITNGQLHCFPIAYEGNGTGQRVGKFVPFTDNGTIAKSCLFENNVSSYLLRTVTSNGSATKCTFSCWVKRDILSQGLIGSVIMMHSNISSNSEILEFNSTDNLHYYEVTSGTRKWNFATVRTFKNTSRWYHIMVARDTSLANQDDRVKIYVDGTLLTDTDFQDGSGALDLIKPAQDAAGYWNQTTYAAVVGNTNSGSYIDGAGYLAEVNMVDGAQLTPSTFGLTDTSTGRWIPKTLSGITYGTNGFRLTFANTAGLTIGDDTSGNTNDFTVTNLDGNDVTTDSPTQNHATFDPGRNGGDWTLSEGNLKIVGTPSTGAGRMCLSGMSVPNSGKIYWEVEVDVNNDSPRYLGIFRDTVSLTAGSSTEDMRYIATRNGGTHDGKVWDGDSTSSQLTTTTSGDIIQFARDGEKLWIGKNNTWLSSGNPSTGANPLLTNIDTKNSNWKMGVWSLSTGLGGASHTFIMNAGQKDFAYTPPTGFKAWQQDNLPENVRGIPDFVFIKNLDQSYNWQSYDSTRGARYYLLPSTSGAETYLATSLQKFLKGGFSVEDNIGVNKVSSSVVAWNWVANNGVQGANTDGSGSALSCTFQTNQDAGFSIVKFQGNGGQTAVEHGLSQAPEFIIQRRRDNGGSNWWCYTTQYTIGSYHYNKLDTNTSWATQSNGSPPTNKVFTSHGWGSDNIIAYCWHSVPGFSYFGSYIGDATTDGPYIHLDFKPSLIWLKSNNSANWYVYDIARSPKNPTDERLVFTTAVQSTNSGRGIDICASGFKVRQESGYGANYSGVLTFVAAWAENPFLGSGSKSPLTAR